MSSNKLESITEDYPGPSRRGGMAAPLSGRSELVGEVRAHRGSDGSTRG
jgi:hypothetical protein